MAGILRGQIRWCDFGASKGAELSGNRCALVLSSDDFNHANRIAVTTPTTRTPQLKRYSHRYVHIPSAGNWASLLQIKTVGNERLGSLVSYATDAEMNEARHKIAEWLYFAGSNATNELTPGSIWTANVPGLASDVEQRYALVLHYNHRNGMAVVALAENRAHPATFPYLVPVTAEVGQVPGFVRAHQLRSISTDESQLTDYTGKIRQQDLEAVHDAIIRLIS